MAHFRNWHLIDSSLLVRYWGYEFGYVPNAAGEAAQASTLAVRFLTCALRAFSSVSPWNIHERDDRVDGEHHQPRGRDEAEEIEHLTGVTMF